MSKHFFQAAAATILCFANVAWSQAPAKLDRVIGEIAAIDANDKHLSVKTDAGAVVTATVDEKTLYLRVPPGEKDLKKAAKIGLENLALGDRAFVRGHFVADDQKSIAAVAVIIMTKTELAQKAEHERQEWQHRGVAGPVTALNPETKEITISTRTPQGTKPVVIEAATNTNFRRYAPDSVRFSDAITGSFGDLKVGDQLRALGDKNEDGGRLKAEAIISGSFRNIAGVIKTIDAGANEITLTDLVAHKPVTVRVTTDTSMHRLPPMAAAMLARRQAGANGGAGGAAGGHPEAPRAAGIPGPPNPEGAKPGAGADPSAGPGGAGPGGGPRRGNFDFQEMLEHLP